MRTEKLGHCKAGEPVLSKEQLQSDASSWGTPPRLVSVLDACCVCGGGTGHDEDYYDDYHEDDYYNAFHGL